MAAKIEVEADRMEKFSIDEATLRELQEWFKKKGIKPSSLYPPSENVVIIFTGYSGIKST